MVENELARPPGEWLDELSLDGFNLLRLMQGLPLVADGSLAARLHGVPVPVTTIDLALAGTAETSGQLDDRLAELG